MRPAHIDIVLRLVVAAALVVDAAVHWHLAGNYARAGAPGMINQGTLFRAEAVAAILVAAYVVLRAGRLAFAAAFLVAGSAFAAVLLYRYVDVPAIGPIPAMYEPIWYAEKTVSAIAEGLGALAAAAGFLHTPRTRQADRGKTPSA